MKIKNNFFLSIITISLLCQNRMNGITDGQQFFGFFATVIVGGIVIYKSGSGPEVLKNSIPQFVSGAGQAIALPGVKKIGNILQKPFLNPIDQQIKELTDQRDVLAARANALQSALASATQVSGIKMGEAEAVRQTLQATLTQQFKLEKKIIRSYEKKEFEQTMKSKLIFP